MFSLIAIGLPKQLLAEATGRSSNALDFEDLHKSYMRDPTLTRLVTDLNAEAIAGSPQGPLYSDHLLYSIAQRLAENARQSPFRMDRAAKLSADQLNRLVQKMEDDMEDGLTLSDLAELLDMPIFHFSRVFQRTVGVTPYRYLLLRRVSRAERMLRDGRLSLAEIAYACGFSSQAHMTTAFAKYSGYSPGLIRRSLAG
ncbi:MAG: AraC family transcriptional regulator [Pseudomonadota bacterium]